MDELKVQAMPLAITLKREPGAQATVTVYNTLMNNPLKIRVQSRNPTEYEVSPKRFTLSKGTKIPITFALSERSKPDRVKDAFLINIEDTETGQKGQQLIPLAILPGDGTSGASSEPNPPSVPAEEPLKPPASGAGHASPEVPRGGSGSSGKNDAKLTVRWSTVLPLFVAMLVLFQVITPVLDEHHNLQLWSSFLLGCAVMYVMMR